AALCGAERISHRVLAEFQARFAPHGLRANTFIPCYGLAEAALAVTCAEADSPVAVDVVDRDRLVEHGEAALVDEDPSRTMSIVCCGTALPGTRVRVVDEGGADLPPS